MNITTRNLTNRLHRMSLESALALAGKRLKAAGHHLRLGVPQVRALEPVSALAAKLVTIKGFTEPAAFLEAVRRHLAELGVAGEPVLPLGRSGRLAGKPHRKVLRVKERRIVGFGVRVTNLTAEESLKLQEAGLGGRHRMGCGYFVPLK
jgi:CRISPR-associated protein Cas6